MAFGQLGAVGRGFGRLGAPGGGAAVPALLPAGSKVMALGHSFVSYYQSTSPARPGPLTNISSKVTGVSAWLKGLDQRFNLDTWADVAAPFKTVISNNDVSGACNGFSGATLFDLYNDPTILDYYLARGPKVVFLQLGTNDITNAGLTLANMQTYFDYVYGRVNATGAWLIAETIYPRVATGVAAIPDGDARLDKLVAYNAWLRGLSRNKYRVSDIASIMGEPRPNQTYWLQADGLHPQDRGAYESAKLLLPILQSIVSAGSYANISPDPAINNIMPNAQMTGTGGSVLSGGGGPVPTGSVSTGYQVSNFAGGSSYACSKFSSDVSGYEGTQVAITPNNDGTATHEVRLTQTANVLLTTLSLAVGDWLQWMQYVEFSAYDGWTSRQATVALGNSSSVLWTTVVDNPLNSGSYFQPADAQARWIVSEPFQITSGVDRLRFTSGPCLAVRFNSTVAGSPTFKVSKPILRKIVSPLTAWNLP